MRWLTVVAVRFWVVASTFIAGMVCNVAAAQEAAEDRSQSFQAVQGAVQEDVPGGPLLVVAYGLILACVIAYVVRLLRLQARSQSDLERLEKALAARAPQAGNDPG
jgi:high-affinity nickel permease